MMISTTENSAPQQALYFLSNSVSGHSQCAEITGKYSVFAKYN